MKKAGDVNDSPTVNADKPVIFLLSVPGFEKYTTYAVYHKEEIGSAAYWLVSCDDTALTLDVLAIKK